MVQFNELKCINNIERITNTFYNYKYYNNFYSQSLVNDISKR